MFTVPLTTYGYGKKLTAVPRIDEVAFFDIWKEMINLYFRDHFFFTNALGIVLRGGEEGGGGFLMLLGKKENMDILKQVFFYPYSYFLP